MSDDLKAGAVLFAQNLPRVAKFYAELVPMPSRSPEAI
jgi:hypothetical protein